MYPIQCVLPNIDNASCIIYYDMFCFLKYRRWLICQYW